MDEGRQAQTLEWLRKRFDLRLNVDALPLQKLRRVSSTPTTLVDFENPEALDARARVFLRDDAARRTKDGEGRESEPSIERTEPTMEGTLASGFIRDG